MGESSKRKERAMNHEELCRQHAERLASMETMQGQQEETLGRIEGKLDRALSKTQKIEKDLHLAKWLGGIATAVGLTALGAWITKLMG
jgi:hypothetical protein